MSYTYLFILPLTQPRCAKDFVEKSSHCVCVCRKMQQFPNSLWNDKNSLFVVSLLILKMNIGNHCSMDKQLNTFLQTLLKVRTGNFTLRNMLQKIRREFEHTKSIFFASLAAKASLKFLLSSRKAVLCQERQSLSWIFFHRCQASNEKHR